MRIEGEYTFNLPIEEVYFALQDEALLREALPGSVYFRMATPTHYEAAMTLDIPRFGGDYSGSLDVLESEAPRFYRLDARGQGEGRYVTASGTVTLTALGPGRTLVRYEGATDALDEFNRFVQIAAHPIIVRLAGRGLAHLERSIQARRGGDTTGGETAGGDTAGGETAGGDTAPPVRGRREV